MQLSSITRWAWTQTDTGFDIVGPIGTDTVQVNSSLTLKLTNMASDIIDAIQCFLDCVCVCVHQTTALWPHRQLDNNCNTLKDYEYDSL